MSSLFDLEFSPNPYLRYDIGLSYHPLIYAISALAYLLFIPIYAWQMRQSIEYSRVRIYPVFAYYLLARFFEKAFSTVAIIGYECFDTAFSIIANGAMTSSGIAVPYREVGDKLPIN